MTKRKKQTRVEVTITWPNLDRAKFKGHLVEMGGPPPTTKKHIGSILELKIHVDEPVDFMDKETGETCKE